MVKNKKILLIFFIGITLLYIFRNWFFSGMIIGGDLTYMSSATMHDQTILPYAWMENQHDGLGGYAVPFLNIQYNQAVTYLISSLGFDWSIVERLTQLFPLLLLLIIGSVYLAQIGKNKFVYITFLIFSLNTYILMLSGGGQILVAIGYALVPSIFYCFYSLAQRKSEKITQHVILHSLGLGVLFAIEVMIDLRLAYLLFGICFLYFGYQFIFSTNKKQDGFAILSCFILPFIITILLNAFWILPLGIVKQNPFSELGSAYNSTQAVQFLSFAKFENVLGLLHPHWPENIFGKTYFMRPEFLLLPVTAFLALLFITSSKNKKEKTKKRTILFFVLLGIVGIFLGKGSNDPFGGVYLWLFAHIPGFMLFRDSTKWYLLVALSYAVLIPFSLENAYECIKNKTKKMNMYALVTIPNLFILGCIIYFFLLMRPAIFGQLTGTFHPHRLLQDYVKFNKFLSQQSSFSRVMWIPGWERYGFSSSLHPAIGSQDFYQVTTVAGVVQKLQQPSAEKMLQDMDVKYIVIPDDTDGELFLQNRKYDDALYQQAVKEVQSITWLTEIKGFGKIRVFQISNTKDHFWTTSKALRIVYTKQNTTQYTLHLTHATKGDRVIFSEFFDRYWQAKVPNTSIVHSSAFDTLFNSFILTKSGSYDITIEYQPQKWIYMGMWIGGFTMLIILGYFIWYKTR